MLESNSALVLVLAGSYLPTGLHEAQRGIIKFELKDRLPVAQSMVLIKALSCRFSHYFKYGVCVHVVQKIDMWSVALSRS